MTAVDSFARWPLRRLWDTPEGDRLRIVGYGDGRVLAEHPGRRDPHWVPHNVAETWREVA